MRYGKTPVYFDVQGIPVAALPTPEGGFKVRAFDEPGLPNGRPFTLLTAEEDGDIITEAQFNAMREDEARLVYLRTHMIANLTAASLRHLERDSATGDASAAMQLPFSRALAKRRAREAAACLAYLKRLSTA